MADNTTNLSSDIYNISDFITTIENRFTGIDENTLYVGIFGYLNEVLSNVAQNSIVMAAEYANESIPAKAKFEKNIITHALSLGFTDINAVPASMNVLIGFLEDDIISNIGSYPMDSGVQPYPNSVVIDKDTIFMIEEFEFRLEYDLEIKRSLLPNGEYVYSANYIYDASNPNPISNITNPYLQAPVRMKTIHGTIIYIQCTLRQYEETKIYKKILSSSAIENKILSFDFNSQLAAFDIDVVDKGNPYHITPLYEGINNSMQQGLYCNYTYIDENTIRIKFNSNSYEPSINTDITINIKTTQGTKGNFTYNEEIVNTIESNRCGYRNISCTIKPITDSQYGTDKKSIEELKRIIPRESSSRGSITNSTDLENFFNMINTDKNKVYFYKKRDNQVERLYYSYIILKNDKNNIIPTNTIDIRKIDTKNSEDDPIVFKTGTKFIKDESSDYYIITTDHIDDFITDGDNTVRNFGYMIPYTMVINRSPLYISYYMNIFEITKYLQFDYLNSDCQIQFIGVRANWRRDFLTDNNKYKFDFNILQSISSDSLLEKDDEGKVELDDSTGLPKTKVRVFGVLYDENNIPYSYVEAKLLDLDQSTYQYGYRFEFITDDDINEDNKINITNVMEVGSDCNTDSPTSKYFNSSTNMNIFIVTKDQNTEITEDVSKLIILNDIIKGLDDYNVTNIYSVSNGITFYYNYSHIISSTVSLTEIANSDTNCNYNISSVPVIRHNYIEISDDMNQVETDEAEKRMKDLVFQLDRRKEYIDYSLKIIEDSFGVDFKFFNTYGPSKVFMTETSDRKYIDNVALSLKFRVKFVNKSDSYLTTSMISDIKEYIEDITNISDMHIPNIITMITNKYREYIVYFEFLEMNGMGPGVQHIYNQISSYNALQDVPEFLNVVTDTDGNPDIQIVII